MQNEGRTIRIVEDNVLPLTLVTSQLFLAANAPTNPVYMATRRQPERRARKTRLYSECQTKKRKQCFITAAGPGRHRLRWLRRTPA